MKRLALIFLAALLASCGSVPVENRNDALLMPEPVAKALLVKYLGASWVNNPHGRYIQGGGRICGTQGYGSLPFKEINVVRFFPRNRELLITKTNWLTVAIPCTQLVHTVNGDFSSEEVKDIVDALVSLGATIDQQR